MYTCLFQYPVCITFYPYIPHTHVPSDLTLPDSDLHCEALLKTVLDSLDIKHTKKHTLDFLLTSICWGMYVLMSCVYYM